MYFWIAEVLAKAGYQVMTFQQTANFVDGTVDALRFFLSTPDHPYRPVGWSEADAGHAAAGRGPSEQIDWYNPGLRHRRPRSHRHRRSLPGATADRQGRAIP